MSLPSSEDARALMLAEAVLLPPETIALDEAEGRVLAEALAAERDQPPFDASAMDGWAVRSADAQTAVELDVAGESAAGHGFGRTMNPGEAVRIFTGAPVPDGADAVVIQEEAQRDGFKVRLGPVAPGANLRPRGGDFHAGDRLLEPGMRLDPWRISLAASAGREQVKAARRPRIALLSTGEELARPGGAARPDQIYESCALPLSRMAAAWGAATRILAPAGDDDDAIAQAVQGVDAEVLVTIGGASVGDYDLVKPALRRLGLALQVEGVNLRPGRPTWFGRLGDGRLVLGLPGNPASAFVCAELFLRPLLLRMQGADPAPRRVFARLDGPVPANGPREHFMRAALSHGADGVLTVAPFPEQDSSLVTVLALANALLRRPPGAPAAPVGEVVEVTPLDRI